MDLQKIQQEEKTRNTGAPKKSNLPERENEKKAGGRPNQGIDGVPVYGV